MSPFIIVDFILDLNIDLDICWGWIRMIPVQPRSLKNQAPECNVGNQKGNIHAGLERIRI